MNDGDDIDDSRARRVAKRCAGVQAVKRTPAYILVVMSNKAERPASPDPFDERVSKRKWEKSMMDWRNDLRAALRQIHAMEHSGSAATGE